MVEENLNSMEDDIAIIGMVGRFPEANNLDEFWKNLHDGIESVKILTANELRDRGFGDYVDENPNFVSAEASLDDATLRMFDASFFGMSPKEAEIMDPQHRLFLEACWELFEQAGYSTEHYNGRVSVFGSTGFSGYLESNLLPNRKLLEEVGSFRTQLGNDKDFIATRVSYKMGFTGPSFSVSTLCSSAAVAIHMARESLLNFESDFVLAGGVNISISTSDTLYYQEGGIGAGDGHCRAYDERASGTVAGSGLGIVALKRLEDAINDGDTICAILKGSAVNNDGATKASYTAPSPEGQAEVISQAIAISGVSPETITYIDGHGTATNIGDPIEIAALTKAYRQHTEKKNYCGIGSVKTNIGHLVTAGGIASFIKTVLALQNKKIPPSLNFEKPNPKIDFANSPFYVNHKLKDWDVSEHPRRGAVSSFGIGGTNVHLILEESNQTNLDNNKDKSHLIVLSAKSPTALAAMKSNLQEYLSGLSATEQSQRLSHIAYTLQVGRCSFEHRYAVVVNDGESLSNRLTQQAGSSQFYRQQKPIDRSLCFMFPGQGSQYNLMVKNLYEKESVFRACFDRCTEIASKFADLDINQVIFSDDDNSQLQLRNTKYAQVALFITEYSLAQLLISWNIRPDSMIGHSIGEYVAACLANVFTLEDAIKLVCARGALMASCEPGTMAAVSIGEESIQKYLSDDIEVAAVNASGSCVVSGPVNAMDSLVKQLESDAVNVTRLKTSHAFHSKMMEPILEEYRKVVAEVALSQPELPFISNLTGEWITSDQTTDPDYWVQQLRSSVRFYDGINTLIQDDELAFVEVGPGESLSTLTRMAISTGNDKNSVDKEKVISSLPRHDQKEKDVESILNCQAKLWLLGVKIDWNNVHSDKKMRRLPLPTYPFERKVHWVEPKHTLSSHDQSFAQADEVKLYQVEDIQERCQQSDSFDSGQIAINIDWKEKSTHMQQPQLVAIMELRSQLNDICQELSKTAGVNLQVSGLTLSKLQDESNSLSIDDDSTTQVLTGSSVASDRPDLETPYQEPLSENQKKMCMEWEKALGFSPVGINDNFFDLGGHSLIAAALVNYVRQEYKVEVTLVELLEGPTVAKVVDLVETKLWLKNSDEPTEATKEEDGETLVL